MFGLNQEVLAGATDASSTSSGYDVDNLVSGSRDLHWLSDTASTSGGYIGYQLSNMLVNYCAVCKCI